VLVHDAARPLLTPDLAERVIAAALAEGVDAAIAAAPVTDTFKRVGNRGGEEEGDGAVLETLDRSRLWAVQTPQVFRRAALERALDVPDEVLAQATDDAWLVERAGGRVVVVEAPRENLKVTTPLDLALAGLLIDRRT
jgi:2-C-methyl-D-erythritol 4-phosphate cytidylyltransferase